MTEYMVLLHGDERRWAEADEATRRRAYDLHEEFSRLAAERGHRITGGAELDVAAKATVVRGTRDGVSISEGPYAETVEQLGGYYLVESDDLPDLLRLLGIISDGEPVEVRPTVTATEDLGATYAPAAGGAVAPEHAPQEAAG
ncbi:YciI family protein [Georgenia sp. SUBG003]|uniref:YciI family protein n=1 Tax=Georgenia sp. SUBG003 TaxID=1497974 RepID=UPI000AB88945